LVCLSRSCPARPRGGGHDGRTGIVTTAHTIVQAPDTWCLTQDLTLLVPSPDPYYNKPMSYGMQLWGDDIVLDCNGFTVASGKGMGSGAFSPGRRLNLCLRRGRLT
jgi:hypothetical protein